MTNYSSNLPRELYLAEHVRELDRIAIEEYGIEGFTLMQRAGAVCFQSLQQRWPETRRVLVFAGGGNNGGDGYVVAALARQEGLLAQVVTLAAPEKLLGDAKIAWQWAKDNQVEIVSFEDFCEVGETCSLPTVLVDGMLGTGLDRALNDQYAQAVDLINNSGLPVLAIDIPSGLHADTGIPLGNAVVADVTASFIGLKQGLLTGAAGNHAGTILFSDLDVPDEVYKHASAPAPSAIRIDINNAARQLEARRAASHKGDFGHVLVVGGDYGMGGAVLMAAEAAQRTGAGLVSVITRSQHRGGFLARRPEIMMAGTEDEHFDASPLFAKASVVVVGPGLGSGEWSRLQLQRCLSAQVSENLPLVVDADGLNLLAERASEENASNTLIKRDNWILTPHPGEAARLLNCERKEIGANRFKAVRALQEKWGGHCLLKGHGSLTLSPADNDRVHLCSEGNPGMASGGMGDILAGIIAGLVAQGLDLDRALRAAVCIHAEAADLAAETGQRGLLATDLLPYIRQLVNTNQHN